MKRKDNYPTILATGGREIELEFICPRQKCKLFHTDITTVECLYNNNGVCNNYRAWKPALIAFKKELNSKLQTVNYLLKDEPDKENV